VIRTGLKLGALGGPHTFNGQAAEAMVERYPEFAMIVHYPTSDEAVAAALRGEVDATCAPEQTSISGFHAGMLARIATPGSPLHVVAEITRMYHCSLLGKPGAGLAQVRHVLGHSGSIAHSRTWLEANLPTARIEVVTSHSLVAAKAVLDGDGSIGSVGSPELAAKLGLVEVAKDIDGGSMVSYWAVSLRQLFSDAPNRLVVTGRFGDDAEMSKLIGALLEAGYALRTVYPRASGRALDEYDCMLRFKGSGHLDTVRAALSRFRSARLAGAWDARES
jgi:prephenate dehydratase